MGITCLPFQTLCAIRGQAREYVMTVLNDDGTPTDLTGAVIVFGIASSSSQPYSLELSTSVADNVITAILTSAECAALTGKKYYFSSWVTTGTESTPVARGYLEIQQDSETA